MIKHPIKFLLCATSLLALTLPLKNQTAQAYPIDAENTGIGRLVGSNPATQAKGATKLSAGALLSEHDINLQLLTGAGALWDFDHAERDPGLQAALDKMFKSRSSSYSLVIADITDPENIAWAGLRENRSQIPGSVGKVITMLGFFSELERAFPNIEDRERILATHRVTAGEWSKWDSHRVPRYNPETNVVTKAKIAIGETYNLSEWLDFTIAYSANAAAATIWKETVLLRHFGATYPPSPEQEAQFFKDTRKSDLWKLASEAVREPMLAADLDPETFWIGSFWTRTAKQLIPGNGNSRGTPLEMARYLVRLEQGRLVDHWSSLKMKKYLYMTSRRYRYVYGEALKPSAVYFKSGSLYSCREEEGFTCGKYKGNRLNAMNSIAIIETPATDEAGQKRYIAALTSDVRKVNSAWDHSRIGSAVDEVIRTREAATIAETGSDKDIKGAGG